MRRSRIAAIAAALMVVGNLGAATAAEDPESQATYVTGTIVESFGTPPEVVEGTQADRLVMLTEREIDWSDPRLPSRMLARTLLDTREGAHPDGTVWPSINATSYRLEDAEGTWTGVGQGFEVNREWMPEEATELMGVELLHLTGDGAYADLSATLLLYSDVASWGEGSYAFEGFIYDGAPPPAPDPIEPGFTLPDAT